MEIKISQKMRVKPQAWVFSQADLAKAIGVARQTVNMVENGEYNPTLSLCLKICRALGCTLDDLFWEEK